MDGMMSASANADMSADENNGRRVGTGVRV